MLINLQLSSETKMRQSLYPILLHLFDYNIIKKVTLIIWSEIIAAWGNIDNYLNNGIGFASLLLRKVLNDAAEKDYEILWDCYECNEASQKTAQSQNLVFDYKYKVCWFEL